MRTAVGRPTPQTAQAAPTPQTSQAARAAQTTLQALVFAEILKPLAASLGPVGDSCVTAVVQRCFDPTQR